MSRSSSREQALGTLDDRRILASEGVDVSADVDLIASEFREGFRLVGRITQPAVTIFGSARVGEHHTAYAGAREVARLFAEAGWAVVTGGGGGVMEGANRGAKEGGGLSVGFNIRLPYEQMSNRYVDVGYTFAHFYSRKTMLVKIAEGFVLFPGGFGTCDELFEALTLIQTGKVLHFPVVLLGRDFWGDLLGWVREHVLAQGLVAPVDLALLHVTDDPGEAFEVVTDCYERRCAEIPVAAGTQDAE